MTAREWAGCLQVGSAALVLTAMMKREPGDGCWCISGRAGDVPGPQVLMERLPPGPHSLATPRDLSALLTSPPLRFPEA